MQVLRFLVHVLLGGGFIAGGMVLWFFIGIQFEKPGCMAGMATLLTSPVGGALGLAVYLWLLMATK